MVPSECCRLGHFTYLSTYCEIFYGIQRIAVILLCYVSYQEACECPAVAKTNWVLSWSFHQHNKEIISRVANVVWILLSSRTYMSIIVKKLVMPDNQLWLNQTITPAITRSSVEKVGAVFFGLGYCSQQHVLHPAHHHSGSLGRITNTRPPYTRLSLSKRVQVEVRLEGFSKIFEN